MLLGKILKENGINVTHAPADADRVIVSTDVNSAKEIGTVVIGEDTDLLILLCFHAKKDQSTLKTNKSLPTTKRC